LIFAPRLDVDLGKIYYNTCELVARLKKRGLSVTGVTKATLGSIEIGSTMLQAGVTGIGDSRIESIRAMRLASLNLNLRKASMTLLRSPMLSQVEQVVRYADLSFNTEVEVIKKLSLEAQRQRRTHQVILMVELGDLREGIMPEDLLNTVDEVNKLPNIVIKGIGTNLACRSGVSPDATNMSKLTLLAEQVEAEFDLKLETISGGNSANLPWALFDAKLDAGRVNDLRLGEAILLGRETLQRQPIDGLHTDAITFTAEVIESKLKPTLPTGDIAQTAFGEPQTVLNRGTVMQGVMAAGLQDIDPSGLQCPAGIEILGASSDHLIVESLKNNLFVGQEIKFQINYSALLRAMTSQFVSKVYTDLRTDLAA
jgi:ornithine racemase